MQNFKLRDVIFILVGVILGVTIMGILWPKRIAKLENGEEVVAKTSAFNITANDIYNELKNNSGVNALINLVDKKILEEKYKLTQEDLDSIEENANYYFEMYEQNYGVSKEDFLKNNNFKSEEEFISYLKLDYLRKKYYDEFLINKIKDSDISDYYNKNVFAPFNVEHILVKISGDVKDADAKSKANEILNKLKKGITLEEVKKEYKEEIVNETFKVEFNTSLDESFLSAAKKLKDNSYTKELVKSSYGYHIIFRKDTLEKPSLDKAKETIISILKKQLEEKKENSYANSLINLRNEKDFNIKDTDLNNDYNKYINELNS